MDRATPPHFNSMKNNMGSLHTLRKWLRAKTLGFGVTLLCLGGATATSALAKEPFDFLPLPEQAKPVAEPAEGYRLQRVGTNGYVVMSGVVQANFFVTKTGVVVVDAPPVLADKLVKAIKSVTHKPVTHVILTHDHADHAGGASAFPGAKIVAHALTAELMRVYPDPKRPIPTLTFSGARYDLKVGGTHFQLIYPGPNHETGNIIVYIPEQRIAMMTDLFAPGWAPYLGWGNADHIPGLLKSYDTLLSLDFDVFLAGHAYRIGNRHDVEVSRAFFLDLWNWTKETIAATPFDPSKAEPGNLWLAQSIWFKEIADKVTPRLIAKWGNELAAVDAFTHSTVMAVVVSTFTDAPNIPDDALKP